MDGEGLPFSDELVRFAWCDREHGQVERSDSLHGEDIEGAEGDAVLFAVAAAAVDDGERGTGLRLALAGTLIHEE